VSIMLTALLLAQSGVVSEERMNAIAAEAQARLAVINTLLDAMNRHDQRAFKAAGGDKIAFGADPEMTFAALMGPETARLRIDSFSGFATCTRDKRVTAAADWFTVTWECPPGARNGTSQFAFKFAGRSLLAIQALRQSPKVVVN
jgi:hypothetical protein